GLLGTAHPRINILDTAVCITIKYTGFSPSFLFPAPCSLLPAPCSLKTQNLYLIEVQTAKSDRNSRPPWQN
ncbi:MAG: hypothetical protein F6K26_50850, partial [Moorea sp. SIO2I5]|nr:hypothetical protein [Moorena sp. SIO2I5]